MSEIVISIIVPVYNQETYLSRCIDSCLSQTYKNFELIIINDGSTDDSEIICDKYKIKDKRIKVFHQENSGVTRAREVGVKKASGHFITFVDSDDILEPQALESYIRELLIHEELPDIIISDSKWGTILKEDYVNGLLNNQIPWGCVAKLYKRDLFEPSPFNIPRYFNVGEDLIMQLNLINSIQNAIVGLENVTYSVTNNPNSVTHTRIFSVEYELNFIEKITDIVTKLNGDFRVSLYNLKLNSLYGLIKNKVKVCYSERWIQELRKEYRAFGYSTKSTKARILLFVPNNTLCRILLGLKEFIFSKKGIKDVFVMG